MKTTLCEPSQSMWCNSSTGRYIGLINIFPAPRTQPAQTRNKSMRTKIFAASFLCLCTLSIAAARRGVTAEDYYAFKNVTDARLSPNGKLVVYTVTSADRQRNKRFSEIWLTATDGSRPGSPFTTGPSSSSPRWSPDGKSVAFVSTRPDSG